MLTCAGACCCVAVACCACCVLAGSDVSHLGRQVMVLQPHTHTACLTVGQEVRNCASVVPSKTGQRHCAKQGWTCVFACSADWPRPPSAAHDFFVLLGLRRLALLLHPALLLLTLLTFSRPS